MEKNQFQINILGTSFSIQTDENKEKMEKIISILKNKSEMVENNLNIKDPLKNMIISCIVIIDDLLKEKENKGNNGNLDSAEVERITLQIMDKIDKKLE